VWAQPGERVEEKLEAATKELQLHGESTCFCNSCKQAKLTRVIPRRLQDALATKSFEQPGIDIVYITTMENRPSCTLKYTFHTVDSVTKWH
jgi:hypothetical protein